MIKSVKTSLVLAITIPVLTMAASSTRAGNYEPRPVARARIQIGPPLSPSLLRTWRSELFAFRPLPAPGTNIDALQAIQAADKVFVRGPKAYVFAVHYGKMTNPRQTDPRSAGYVWVVMFQRDTVLPTSCPAHGCPPSLLRHRERYAQSNAVIDARTGYQLFMFDTK